MATQRKPRDMIRWARLTDEQQELLDRLFAACPGHQDVLREIKRNDGDAMPLIKITKQLWDDVQATRKKGVQAFRNGFMRANGLTPSGEPRNRDSLDTARAYLFVWYDHMYARPVPLLEVEDGKFPPRPTNMVLFDVWKKPLVLPNVKKVNDEARRLVTKSVKKNSDRYVRARRRKQGNRYSEQLVEDLMKHFQAKRSLIRGRLNDAVFSLEREFPDLVYEAKV